MKKIVILYSGGLDSRILYRWTKINYPNSEIKCIYYDYGNLVCQTEIKTLPDFVDIRRLDWFNQSSEKLVSKVAENHKGNIYIPGRNLVFAVLAATQELPDLILMGGLYEECHSGATDKNDVFIDKFNDTINYVLSPFKNKILLKFPFVDLKFFKKDVIDWAIENGISKMEISKAYSCFNYSEDQIACGECHSCMRSFSFFYRKRIPIKFKKYPFVESNFAFEYILKSLEQIEGDNYQTKTLLYDIEYESIKQFFVDNEQEYKIFLEENDIFARLDKIIELKTYEDSF